MDKHQGLGFAPARLLRRTAGDFLTPGSDVADLFVLFNPRFDLFGSESPTWLEPGQLECVVAQGKPIAVFSYARLEQMVEEWLISQFGFSAVGAATSNPYCPDEGPNGGWSTVAWEISPSKLNRCIDDAGQKMFDFYRAFSVKFFESFDAWPQAKVGELEEISPYRAPSTTMAVALAVPNHWVDPESGEIYEEVEGKVLGGGLFAIQPEHAFDASSNRFQRALWAMEATAEFLDSVQGTASGRQSPPATLSEMVTRLRAISAMRGEPEDGPLFPADVMQQFAKTFLEPAGIDLSPEDFLDQMRVDGGFHGSTAPGWHALLDTLGWNLDALNEKPVRFQPACYANSPDFGWRFPVVCENYAFLPYDDEDKQANEAKAKLAETYPSGVVLVFKSIPCIEIANRVYSFGGLILLNGQWAPFALNEHCDGIQSILDQVSSGFTFENPAAQYEDRHGRVARALNFMNHGQDPNDSEVRAVRLHTRHGWFTVIPDELE